MESAKNNDVSGCNEIQVTLRITEVCNRKCQYCHWNKGKHYKTESILEILDVISKQFKNDPVLIYLHGGEPTLHPDLLKILKRIKELNFKLELQTNFDNYKILFESLKYIDLLNLSFHYPNNFNLFKQKILNIKDSVNINCVDLVYVPEFENEIYKMKKFLNKIKIHNEITYNYFESAQYEENIKKSKIYNLLTDQEKIKNKYFAKQVKINNLCDTTKYIIINGDGEVFRCSHQLTNYPSSGNILKDRAVFDKVMINTKCPYNYCGYEYEYLTKE